MPLEQGLVFKEIGFGRAATDHDAMQPGIVLLSKVGKGLLTQTTNGSEQIVSVRKMIRAKLFTMLFCKREKYW